MEDKAMVNEDESMMIARPVKPILDMLSIAMTDMETRIGKLENICHLDHAGAWLKNQRNK